MVVGRGQFYFLFSKCSICTEGSFCVVTTNQNLLETLTSVKTCAWKNILAISLPSPCLALSN